MTEKKYALVIPALQGGEGGQMYAIQADGVVDLEVMREHIGCQSVDVVRLDAGGDVVRLDMWVDDEGLLGANPQWNARAMALTLACYGRLWQPYVGNALVCVRDVAGESRGLTQPQVNLIRHMIRTNLTRTEAWMGARSFRQGRRQP